MDWNIETICGEVPLDYKPVDLNDSNYIFEADKNFIPINLHNFWGDSVTVNSYIECSNYVEGGFRENIYSIFDISFITIGLLGSAFILYKIIKTKILAKSLTALKVFIKNIIFQNYVVKYFLFLFFLIQNFLLFDYIRTKAVRSKPFIDEYISLASNYQFLKNLDFNAGDFIGGSYSVYLTSGPISAIGGVIGWNLTSNLIIARISNFYWILLLQLIFSIIIIKIYKSDYKFLIFMNSFILILVPWWQGSLYMIGEFASVIILLNSFIIINKFRRLSLILISISIFFGKLLNLLPALIFLVLWTFKQKSLKKIPNDLFYFSIPLFSWLALVSFKYADGGILDYLYNLYSLIVGHQSTGLNKGGSSLFTNLIDTIYLSEVSNWNIFDKIRIGLLPILFIYLLLRNINNINRIFGEITIPLAGSVLSTYIWFWIASPTKWMRYSQHFTIMILITLMYLINFNVLNQKLDQIIVFSSVGLHIENEKQLMIVFFGLCLFIVFVQSKVSVFNLSKILIILILIIDIAIPFFEKDNFANMDTILIYCKEDLSSMKCLEEYENNQ